MQAQRPQLLSRIPRPFARLLRFLFYMNIVLLIASLFGMSRLDIVRLLPLFLLAGFCLWIIAHWTSLDRYQRAIYALDDDGLLDRAFAGGGMKVGWDEIAQVHWTTWGGFRGLKVVLKDTPAVLARLSLFDRVTAYINLLCYGSPLVLWQAWSELSLEEYRVAIDNHLAQEETK